MSNTYEIKEKSPSKTLPVFDLIPVAKDDIKLLLEVEPRYRVY